MVSLYVIHADVEWPRVTRNVDVLANMEVLHSNLAACTTALEELGLRAQPDSNGATYRFSTHAPSTPGALIVDLLAPDHRKPNTKLRTSGGPTLEIAGGTKHYNEQEPSMFKQPTDDKPKSRSRTSSEQSSSKQQHGPPTPATVNDTPKTPGLPKVSVTAGVQGFRPPGGRRCEMLQS